MNENPNGTVTNDNEARLRKAITLAESGEQYPARRLLRQILAEEPYNFEARELLDRLAGVQWLDGESGDVPSVVRAAGCIYDVYQLVMLIIGISLAIGFLFWILTEC